MYESIVQLHSHFFYVCTMTNEKREREKKKSLDSYIIDVKSLDKSTGS